MGKKYVPSGYQILEIESTDKDNDDILLKNTDDEKLLYELFKSGKILEKPILLRVTASGTPTMCGFPIVSLSAITLTWTDGVDYDSYSFSYDSENDEITVIIQAS